MYAFKKVRRYEGLSTKVCIHSKRKGKVSFWVPNVAHLLHFVLVTKECSWLAWEQTLNCNTLGEHLNTVKESADCRNSFWQPVYQHRAKKHRGRLVSVLSTHAKRRGTSQTFFVWLLRVYGTSEVGFLGSEEVYSWIFHSLGLCKSVYILFTLYRQIYHYCQLV